MGRKLRVELESKGDVRNNVSAPLSDTRVNLPIRDTPHPSNRRRPQTSQQSIVSNGSNPAGSSASLTSSTVPRNEVAGTQASDTQENPFKCPCGKQFAKYTSLRSHQRNTKRARPEGCRQTDETDEAVGTPKKEAIIQEESKTKKAKCGCGRTFPTLGHLRHHQADKANSGKCRSQDAIEPEKAVKSGKVSQPQSMSIMCGCGQKFATVASIQQHQKMNQESWTCHTWEHIGPGRAVQSRKSVRVPGWRPVFKPIRCACGRRFGTRRDIQCHQSQWSPFDNVKCREGITTFMGRAYDPNKETIAQAVAKLGPIEVCIRQTRVPINVLLMSSQNLDAPPEQSRVHWMRRDTGKHLHTILGSSIQPADIQVSSKNGYLVLGSYNWSSVGHGGGVYFVPGKSIPNPKKLLHNSNNRHFAIGAAPVWQELPVPMQLPPDIDLPPMNPETAQDLPEYPYQASLEAVKAMSPDWRINDVDILADWRVLQALLTLTTGKQSKGFRMKLYLVKNTLVIEMRNERAEAWRNGNQAHAPHPIAHRMYGRSLEPVFTRWGTGLEQSEAHFRTIQYNLGPLNCVVRFQADACYTDPKETESTGSGGKYPSTALETIVEEAVTTTQPAAKDQTEGRALAAEEREARAANSESIVPDNTSKSGRTAPTQTTLTNTGPNIIMRGSGTPQEYMCEIKTKTQDTMDTATILTSGWMPQLWFTRISNLIVGEHTDGLVRGIQHHRLSAGAVWEQWEEQEKHQLALRKLVTLLSELKTLAAEYDAFTRGHGAMFAVYECKAGGPRLQMYESKEDREIPLPEDLVKSLWRVDEWASGVYRKGRVVPI